MKAELRAKFFDRFVKTGRERIATAQKAVSSGDAETARIELHSLSGEASMLGFEEIGTISREAEHLAQAWEKGDNKARVACGREARKVVKAIEALAAEGPNPAESESAESPATPAETATTKAVLVVDDSELAGESLQDALEDKGVASDLACTEFDALEHCKRHATPLVLLDVNMPGVDTGELCRTLRGLPHTPSVYLVSGLSDDELRSLVDVYQASGYISKAAGSEVVARKVSDIVAGKDG